MNKQSFSDDTQFDPNSPQQVIVTPDQTPIMASQPPSIRLVPSYTSSQPVPSYTQSYQVKDIPRPFPWPVIIISLLGAFIVIYTAVASGLSTNDRIFGIVVALPWTIVLAGLLWALWNDGYYSAAWWLLLIAVTFLITVFVIILVNA